MREFLSSFTKIEFEKVRQRIGGLLQTPMAVEHLQALGPKTDEAWIRLELGLTSEMKRLLEEGTPVPIRPLADVNSRLAKRRGDEGKEI